MDWYDGEPRMTISQAFACAPRMPTKPRKAKWDNSTPVYTNSELGSIFELITEADRIMHTHTCSGHCFVWNYVNQPREDGFRLFTFRSKDGWGRVSIQTRTMETLIDGSGSRMYAGNWRTRVDECGVRLVKTVEGVEALVLLDFDKMYSWGGDLKQEIIDAMKEDVLNWWRGLPEAIAPAPTEEELSRKLVYR